MKRSPNFLMRQVAGSWVVVPVGAAAREFPGMIRLNQSGKLIWELLEQDQTAESLTQALLDRYNVTETQARQDVDAFLAKLTAVGALV